MGHPLDDAFADFARLFGNDSNSAGSDNSWWRCNSCENNGTYDCTYPSGEYTKPEYTKQTGCGRFQQKY